ncbi:MAG: class I SAM-dependent methyltransferase [Eubacteriales bacterium]|nr:class I SAM-dependent methyltransferase [Eubacteriales bacterium]
MEEHFYALDMFEELERTLAGIAEAMPIKRKAIDIYMQKGQKQRAKDTYSELEAEKKKLLDTVMNLSLLFSECEMADSADFANRLYASVKQFNLITPDYAKLISAVEMLCSNIPKNEKVNARVVGHLMNEIRMGYYPTDTEHIKMIKSSLVFPENQVNILDPCCGEGLALETLASGVNADSFGIEIDKARRTEADNRINHVGYGSYFYSRIGQDSFHCIFLNPPYLNKIEKDGIKTRSEKRFLVESLHHLMPDGVLIYVIPYYRLTFDICRILCDNFRDISVYRFLDDEFSKFSQIAVLGIKKERDDGSDEAEVLSQYATHQECIPLISKLKQESYPLPDIRKDVDLFRGAEFNLGELKRQLARSRSIEMLFEKSKLEQMVHRPLMPLNLGQIGLIGGSGLINGYVDCDEPHVIKGRVIKELKCRENKDLGTLTETRVNKMIFNVLTPDGVKRLA